MSRSTVSKQAAIKASKRASKKTDAKTDRKFAQRDPSIKPDKAGFSVAGTLRGKRKLYDGPAGKQRPAKHHIFATWLKNAGGFDAQAMADKYPSVTVDVVRAWVSAWRTGRGKFINATVINAKLATAKQIAVAQKA
jgi:hypothetical protein